MLESITYRLHVLVVVLGHRNVVRGAVRLRRYTVGTVTRQSVSRRAALDNTFSGQTGDVRDTGEGSTVLADRREGRQGKHASTTWIEGGKKIRVSYAQLGQAHSQLSRSRAVSTHSQARAAPPNTPHAAQPCPFSVQEPVPTQRLLTVTWLTRTRFVDRQGQIYQ